MSLTAAAGSLKAVVFPTVGSGQQVSLVLNQVGGAIAYTLAAAAHPAETDTFTFSTVYPNPLAGAGATLTVPPGTYLARLKVDAADSPLTVDSSGTFNGPTVTV